MSRPGLNGALFGTKKRESFDFAQDKLQTEKDAQIIIKG
ncbi:hypothetical protein SAMN05421856_10472 [Chryseobacterium taichungense]|uniref:Uncharacterized protein n=1 Tax=Chryseobacterium taichungense TaxID=295069 RepID=A0A1H7Z907_9FLAO|nr:hypothetical protein SAMN05421856_10472 [Chryseobacterium taichungense]